MEQYRPRIFLSHSKKDIDFIYRVERDLRKAKLDPWLDEFEIHHGRSWREEIFQNGLPKCDIVLVYFSENTLLSKVTKEEIDATLCQTLNDNYIGFLLYVSNADVRKQLRSDLLSLQCPEWNEENYYQVLPSVVSEIWHNILICRSRKIINKPDQHSSHDEFNDKTEMCPKCKLESPYIPNPMYMHICQHCGAEMHEWDLIDAVRSSRLTERMRHLDYLRSLQVIDERRK